MSSNFVCLFLHFFERIFHFKHSPKVIFKSFSSASSVLGCSSLAVLESLVFVGIVLLFVVLSMFLPCLPIFSSNYCNWGPVSDDHSFRYQWLRLLLMVELRP